MTDLKINTYPLHIGDWHSGTSRMSLAERGAYITLCNQYYLDQGEGWTVNECLRICAAMSREEQKAVKTVLASKFEQTDGGYRHGGMDKRIAEIQAASERNQERARIAAEKRWARDKQSSDDARSNAQSMPEALLEECHPKAKSQKPVIDDDDDAGATPARSDGVSSTDDLGWPSDQRRWISDLIAVTDAADLAKQDWPLHTSGIVTGWHETDRFEWRDVVAGVRATMLKVRADDPPRTWKYFSPAIARAKRDRTTATPEAPANERRNDNHREPSPGRSTDYLRAAIDLDNQRRSAQSG